MDSSVLVVTNAIGASSFNFLTFAVEWILIRGKNKICIKINTHGKNSVKYDNTTLVSILLSTRALFLSLKIILSQQNLDVNYFIKFVK